MKLTTCSTIHIDAMMRIVEDAQQFLAELEIDQWQDGYPNNAVLLNDINNKESYCVIDEDGQMMGMTMFSTRPEKTYETIDGSWITKDDAIYGVIHRLAVSHRFRSHGVAKFIFKECEAQLRAQNVPSMRIDTHEANKGMQKLIVQLGYEYCGVIQLERGGKRLAYEKVF